MGPVWNIIAFLMSCYYIDNKIDIMLCFGALYYDYLYNLLEAQRVGGLRRGDEHHRPGGAELPPHRLELMRRTMVLRRR